MDTAVNTRCYMNMLYEHVHDMFITCYMNMKLLTLNNMFVLDGTILFIEKSETIFFT